MAAVYEAFDPRIKWERAGQFQPVPVCIWMHLNYWEPDNWGCQQGEAAGVDRGKKRET